MAHTDPSIASWYIFMYCSVANTKGNLWLRFMSPQIEGALLLGLIDNIINHEPKYTQSYIMEDNSVLPKKRSQRGPSVVMAV